MIVNGHSSSPGGRGHHVTINDQSSTTDVQVNQLIRDLEYNLNTSPSPGGGTHSAQLTTVMWVLSLSSFLYFAPISCLVFLWQCCHFIQQPIGSQNRLHLTTRFSHQPQQPPSQAIQKLSRTQRLIFNQCPSTIAIWSTFNHNAFTWTIHHWFRCHSGSNVGPLPQPPVNSMI